ncbi:MAG: prepilin-type N-terminal cleavage/methylation domain-containing protein [Phycisphaerales bacterium]|jgi:prepilin-type N-terminal cleavage/methylation domain-containing protein|nr:prepilin-type N-terminal cleavage/methylation domain-containing protein [Phycisphaerales bacterium]
MCFRAGMTLLELMIVLFLLAVIGGLVLPAATSVLDRAAFDSDVQRLRAALVECRVIAQRTGTSLEIALEPGQLVATPWPREEDEAFEPILTVQLMTTKNADGEDLAEPIVLAVALPDGTFVSNGPIGMEDGYGRSTHLVLDQMSGAVIETTR